MFIRIKHTIVHYSRISKLGKSHEYYRKKQIAEFRCDDCGNLFERSRSQMDPKRLSNNFFHVCENCDSKRFAQKKGVERKRIWDLPASSNLDISKF